MKKKIIFLILIASMHFNPSKLYAWANRETHPALTDKAEVYDFIWEIPV